MSKNQPWVKIDLGGYPAKLNINDKFKPKEKIENELSPDMNFEVAVSEGKSLFATWESNKSIVTELKPYLLHLTSTEDRNCLVDIDTNCIHDFAMLLRNHCHDIHSLVFYINSPDDLVCPSPYLELHNNGERAHQSSSGGALCNS